MIRRVCEVVLPLWTSMWAHCVFWISSELLLYLILPVTNNILSYLEPESLNQEQCEVLTTARCRLSPPISTLIFFRFPTIPMHGPHHSEYTSTTEIQELVFYSFTSNSQKASTKTSKQGPFFKHLTFNKLINWNLVVLYLTFWVKKISVNYSFEYFPKLNKVKKDSPSSPSLSMNLFHSSSLLSSACNCTCAAFLPAPAAAAAAAAAEATALVSAMPRSDVCPARASVPVCGCEGWGVKGWSCKPWGAENVQGLDWLPVSKMWDLGVHGRFGVAAWMSCVGNIYYVTDTRH